MSGLDDCTSVLEDILDFLKKAMKPKSSNKKSTALQSDDSDDEGPPAPVRSERIESYEDKDVPDDHRIPLAFSGKRPQKTAEGLDREHQNLVKTSASLTPSYILSVCIAQAVRKDASIMRSLVDGNG
jgi:hypothetical protein